MQAQEKVVVLGVSQYSFKDEARQGDQTIQGCSVHYIVAESLEPFEDAERALRGYKPAKASIDYDAYRNFTTVPGVYEMTVALEPGSDGKLRVIPREYKYISGLAGIDDDEIPGFSSPKGVKIGDVDL